MRCSLGYIQRMFKAENKCRKLTGTQIQQPGPVESISAAVQVFLGCGDKKDWVGRIMGTKDLV